MIKNKKLLMLSLAPISVVPLAVISCGGPKEVTYFEAENFRISSEGTMMGYADETHKQFGPLVIKEKYNGVTIKSIADGAFEGQEGIDNVVLPKTLIRIGSSAFRNIKSPVKYDDSFLSKPVEWDLSHLVDLEEIYSNAFGVDSPSNIQKQIKLSLNLSNLKKLRVINPSAFTQRGISLVNFEGVSNLEIIHDAAFAYNKITSLTLPNSITSLTLPNSITSLGESSFEENQLTSVNIPKSILRIANQTFSTNQLTSIIIPDSISSIGGYAFFNNKLTSINIHDSVTTIGEGAFAQNSFTNLSEIKLPAKFNTEAERTRIGIIIKTPPIPVLEEIPVIKEDDQEVRSE